MADKNSVAPKGARKHRATYSRDKLNGGWLIRVVGPQAKEFAGRTVPVETNRGEETLEELEKLVWSGIDDGNYNPADQGKPTALYSYKPHPKDRQEAEF